MGVLIKLKFIVLKFDDFEDISNEELDVNYKFK